MSVRAVLVGMPGVGKSTVGKLLAKELGVPFADSDDLVEKHAGKKIPEIFAESGEKVFRTLEADVIEHSLINFHGVLSLGGGAVLNSETRKRLRRHPVFLIEASLDVLTKRITNSRTVRPLLVHNPRASLEKLSRERNYLYRSVARETVHSDGGAPIRVVRKIMRLLPQE